MPLPDPEHDGPVSPGAAGWSRGAVPEHPQPHLHHQGEVTAGRNIKLLTEVQDAADEDVFVVEGPTSLCSCFKSFCHCCAGRDIIFRIVDLKTDRQVMWIDDR